MGSSSTDADHRAQIRRQEVVTDLSQQALETEDLEGLLGNAATAVAETLDVEYCAVFERRGDGTEAVLRGSAGPSTDRVGSATVSTDRPSLAGAALRAEEPVVVDRSDESGVSVPELLADRDVDSAVAVRIGPIDDPWGVLSASAVESRSFSGADIDFLERVADVLGSAIENVRTRRDLERTERRFEAIFEDPNILVGLLEPDGTVVDINGTAMEYIDADLADVTGELFWETPWWGEGDDVRNDVKEWTERAAAGEYVEFETDLTRPDGQRYTLEGAFRPVTDDAGEVTSVIVSDRDVTERTERERELEESEQRYRTLVEHFPNGAVALVDEDLTYRTVGGSPTDTADATADEIEGKPVAEAVPSALADELVPRYEAALEGDSSAFETTIDGRVFDIHVVPVRDDDGEVFAALGMSQDVTERYEYERQLEESEQRYRTLIEHFPNGAVGLFDEDLRYQIAGGAAFDEIGASAEDVVGKTLWDRYSPEQAEQLEPRFRAALDGETNAFEMTFHGREWMAYTLPVADDDGEIFGGMIMVQEITERKERERKLRERERRLEQYKEYVDAILDAIDDVFYVVGEDGSLRRWNRSVTEVTGYTDEEIDAIATTELFTADDQEAVVDAVLDGFETGSVSAELELRTKDGDVIPFEFNASTLEDPWGNTVLAGIGRDVSDRVEREKHLERYETIVEVVDDGVYVVDADGHFTMVNETYASMLGYEPAELVGEHVSRIVADAAVLERVGELEATADSDDEWPTMEAELRTADGDTIPVEANFALLPEDDSDWHRVGVARDISERKKRERQLEESERRYRTLVENFPAGAVGLYDENLEYIVVGGEAFDDLEISEDEVAGATLEERYPDDLVAEIEPHFRAALEGEANTFEYQAHGRDVWAHTLPVRNEDDEIFAGMVMVQDVTERREYERKLEESNERLERFAYAASHDLQEPLRMVTSYLTLLENRYADAFDEDGREFLEFAVDGADRMREMIDGLLEYSRVETRGDPFEPMDLNAVLEDVLADLRVRIEETDAEVTIEDLPRVEGDASQVRQVFQNLLSNALTYSGDDPPRVHVGAERCEAPRASERSGNAAENGGEEWVLSVEDEGVGIDPEDQDRVFTIFDRLHSREEYAGTGIGLALCERIVERHGGEIWVESEPGEGSTFFLTLPAPGDE
ncbi:PAS domain S-box protein [Haloterrigena alkaliphila]|uniref:histidine kinase n=1 Tax=Haloterrigena alkaliphila TaxID=2816475 RepID=A0A8A2VBF0_9EURY|nr:PAS domain S-box protein [Haloterrigena alkaliphila]QSW97752.1 PAS domain S-box protein [Haloterrigena alkaliphila]